MAGNAGGHRNMRFQRSQRTICGGPHNWTLDIEILEKGHLYIGNRPRQFSGRESDGQSSFMYCNGWRSWLCLARSIK
jgi:hypothetical protein